MDAETSGDEDGAVRDELVTALFARGFEEHILTDKQKSKSFSI